MKEHYRNNCTGYRRYRTFFTSLLISVFHHYVLVAGKMMQVQ